MPTIARLLSRETLLRAGVVWAVSGAPVVAPDPQLRAEGKPISARQAPAQAGGQPGMTPGDVARGKSLVESSGCFDCHRIGDRGPYAGPDLSDIGGRRTPERLRQALVAPDEEVLPENRFVRFVTKEGTTVTGRLLNQDAISVQLINAKNELKSYLKADLRDYTLVVKGLMPSVEGKLTEPAITDIVSYLSSLKGP
jgi:putative heme-binding domain-containing protein